MARAVASYQATTGFKKIAVIINNKSVQILGRINGCAYTNKNVKISYCSAAQTFKVSTQRGFLPAVDPVLYLTHPQFSPWEETLHDLPKLLVAYDHGQKLRQTIEKLPPFPYQLLFEGQGNGESEIWRAMLVLSFLAHAYVWGVPSPGHVIPRLLAVPLCKVSASLDMPPVLTYATYNLLNWRVLDKNSATELGNIVCLHNFYGGLDEEWFRLVHVDIEAKAAVGLKAMVHAQDAVAQRDVAQVHSSLTEMTHTLKMMQKTLRHMGEKCDPHIYYHRIRKFLSGWQGNPAVPNGMFYEGVWTKPKFFYGETGAQSPIIPTFDAALGVTHPCGPLSDYLQVS